MHFPDRAQTDLIVTALHAVRFGASDIAILEGGVSPESETVVTRLTTLGVPEAEATTYVQQLPPGSFVIAVQAGTPELATAAPHALQQAHATNIQVHSPQPSQV